MYNDLPATTENRSILDRAIKGRNRRDRDGKKRRPVTDGLIEYAQGEHAAAEDLRRKLAEAESKIEVLRDVSMRQDEALKAVEAKKGAQIAELERKLAESDAVARTTESTIASLEARIAELQEQSVALAVTADSVACEVVDASDRREDVA